MEIDKIIAHLKINPADLSKLVDALPHEVGRALADGDVATILHAEPYAMQAMVRAEPYAFAKIALNPEYIGDLSRALTENPEAAMQLGYAVEAQTLK